MSFNFNDLNQSVREKMLEEIRLDISNNNLYLSKRLSQKGLEDYPSILMKHVTNGDVVSLGIELNQDGRFNSMQQTKTGFKRVPSNAHETLAEGQFNRFYIRALALIAIENNQQLEIYRAKEVSTPRSSSFDMIGTITDPQQVLIDLRNIPGSTTNLLADPNSGLSVKLI